MVSTGYQLPFRFVYSEGVLSAGQPAYLHIRFANPQAADELSATVNAFASLAVSGALCGAGIDPSRSTLTLRPKAAGSTHELRWSIGQSLLCDEALVVLAHLLYATQDRTGIDLVEVLPQATHEEPLLLVRVNSLDSTYPPVYRAPAFDIEDADPEGGTYVFEIELEEPLVPSNRDWLNLMLAAWARVVMLGGYGLAPVPPQEGYVEPEEEVTSYEMTVEWSVFKLRADEASITTIVNGLVAFDARCQRIKRLSIL